MGTVIHYDEEFKKQAVKLGLDIGITVAAEEHSQGNVGNVDEKGESRRNRRRHRNKNATGIA